MHSGGRAPSDPATTAEGLLERARNGDETAFTCLVQTWSPTLLRTATVACADPRSAPALVERTWLRVVRDPWPVEPRHRFPVWLCQLLLQEALGGDPRALAETPCGPAVDPARFHPPEHSRFPGDWSAPPMDWPEGAASAGSWILSALGRLPQDQRVVLTLRDVAGCSVREVAEILGRAPSSILGSLNVARSGVREAIELRVREL